ncbi:MAG: Type I phosphodiesterase / nucleotide pyrophosphatase [Lentisphaerae bacterium ADurb.BinA184]|nr:MAG: Type I phosphodiesterase / nucleotide pyrophosphatase [Lentisphaerae bacterium ADurb.BinA184]
MPAVPRILVVQVAALGHELTQRFPGLAAAIGLPFTPCTPPFPAVTCTAQATFRTGLDTAGHGVVCNGVFNRSTRAVQFWNQSAALLPPGRIWDALRARGGRVGILCWQQSLGDSADLILSPAPIHKHGGGMIQDCYTRPPALYGELRRAVGRPFNLHRYWGPMASAQSSRWIADATDHVLRSPQKPDLLLTYIPHLDYVLQKQGPDGPGVAAAVAETARVLGQLADSANQQGYRLVVWGDYAITPARRPLFPNRALRQAGLFLTRQVRRHTYPDLYASPAFAMADHQAAHVYVRDPARVGEVRRALEGINGIDRVMDHTACAHTQAGELILLAAPGAWFAYPWWEDDYEAPDYATHVDIHSKIGFDPCELFWGRLFPPGISTDAARVRGTHGRTDWPAACATNLELDAPPPDTLTGLSQAVRTCLSTPR